MSMESESSRTSADEPLREAEHFTRKPFRGVERLHHPIDPLDEMAGFGGGPPANRAENLDALDLSCRKVFERGGALKGAPDGIGGRGSERRDLRLGLFREDLDPEQVPFASRAPGRCLALHLFRPVCGRRFVAGRGVCSSRHPADRPLDAPQTLELQNDAGDRSFRWFERALRSHRRMDWGSSPPRGRPGIPPRYPPVPRMRFAPREAGEASSSSPCSRDQREAEQVPAVHGGHVARLEGLQGLDVVPVQQVSFTPLQPSDGLHRRAQRLDDLVSRQVSEIPRGQGAQHPETDVRRTGSHGKLVLVKDLVVVGREPVRFLGNEVREIAPGPAGDLSQVRHVFRREPDGPRPARSSVQEPADQRGKTPRREPGSGQREVRRRPAVYRPAHDCAEQADQPHREQEAQAGRTGRSIDSPRSMSTPAGGGGKRAVDTTP